MNNLRMHLVVLVFLPLAMLTALVVWSTFSAVERLVEHRLEKEIELVARAIRTPVETALVEQDHLRLQQSLTAVFEIDRVYGAYVYDAGGRRVAVAGESLPGWREQVQAAELVALGEELGQYADLAGEGVYSYFVPLTDTIGRIEGLLQVVRQESEIAHRLQQIRVRGWWLFAGVLGLMLAVLVFGHRQAVLRHVERLLSSMRRVEEGDRAHRARVDGPRELAAVGAGLNRMLDATWRMQEELNDRRRAHLVITEKLREQEKYAALGRFSAGVAHELGAPLSVIDGDARRLMPACRAPDQARRMDRIRGQVRRTRDLIQQLMDFVRADDRRTKPVELARLVDRAVAGIRPEADSLGIKLETAVDAPTARIRGRAVRIEHALLNLLRNAVQAAHEQVLVRAGADVDGVWLTVDDDGAGVKPAERARIFEPFHTSCTDGGGTGLGLAIVKSVAEEHGAEVSVSDSPDLGGSRFEFRFPGPGHD